MSQLNLFGDANCSTVYFVINTVTQAINGQQANCAPRNSIIGLCGALVSPDSQTAVIQQTDGNMVLYKADPTGSGDNAIWSTLNPLGAGKYNPQPGATGLFKSNGELIQTTALGNQLFSSGTADLGGKWFCVQNDGEAAIYNSASQMLWSATQGLIPPSTTGTTLSVSQASVTSTWGSVVPGGTSTNAGGDGPSNTNIVAIVVGAVSGIVLLAMIGTLVWWIKRRDPKPAAHNINSSDERPEASVSFIGSDRESQHYSTFSEPSIRGPASPQQALSVLLPPSPQSPNQNMKSTLMNQMQTLLVENHEVPRVQNYEAPPEYDASMSLRKIDPK